MLDRQVLEASQVEYKPFGNSLQRESFPMSEYMSNEYVCPVRSSLLRLRIMDPMLQTIWHNPQREIRKRFPAETLR